LDIEHRSSIIEHRTSIIEHDIIFQKEIKQNKKKDC